MPLTTRRTLLQVAAGAALFAALPQQSALAEASATSPLDMPPLGRIHPRRSLDVLESPLSVGFEVLDRKLYDPERCYSHLAELGVKWARCQTGWGRTETVKGRYDFGWLDGIVDSLRKIGIQPWFNLGYGNRLYTPEAPDEAAVGWVPLFDPAARDAWLAYTRAIAEHFAGRVKHWEIWNEPNITGFWKPGKPNAATYVELVKLTAPEIRRRVPEAVIVGGAFAGIPIAYIRECLEKGLAEQIDRISFHPYRPLPEAGYEREITSLRQLLGAYRKGIGLWQGENGCPSRKGGAGALADQEWDETRQAKWLLRRILSDLRLGLDLTSYFLTVDLVGYRGSTNWKGLLRGEAYSPKPAYFAYQCLCALFDAATTLSDAAVQLADDVAGVPTFTAAFERAGKPLYAYWAAPSLLQEWTPRQVSLLLPAGERRLANPVLVDPLSGQAYLLATTPAGDRTAFSLPLREYPLLVADRSVVTLAA